MKIWDAVAGILKGAYRNITKYDITAACLDDRERKFILGNARGEVVVYNFRNGAKMKELDTQMGAIVGLIYCNQDKTVLVTCQDGEMLCYDEMDPEKAVVLTTFEGGGSIFSDDVNNVAFSITSGLVAASSCSLEDGIQLWNFSTGRPDDVIEHNEGPSCSVLSLTFLEPYPLLLVSYSDGNIRVWGVKGSPSKGSCILTFPNCAPPDAVWCGDEQSTEYPLLRSAKLTASLEEEKRAAKMRSSTAGASKEGCLEVEGSVGEKESDSGGEEEMLHEGGRGGAPGRCQHAAWRVNLRNMPINGATLQVVAAVWHPSSMCLYCGDETGRLCRWGLSALFKDPGEAHLSASTSQTDPPRRSSLQQHQKINTAGRIGRRRKANQVLLPHRLAEVILPGAAEFQWGVEGAHDDAINLIRIAYVDPPALLTSGVDRCVKAWTMDGQPQGLLLQGLAPRAPNPRWSFRANLEGLEEAQEAEVGDVIAQVDARRREGRYRAALDSPLSQPPGPAGHTPKQKEAQRVKHRSKTLRRCWHKPPPPPYNSNSSSSSCGANASSSPKRGGGVQEGEVAAAIVPSVVCERRSRLERAHSCDGPAGEDSRAAGGGEEEDDEQGGQQVSWLPSVGAGGGVRQRQGEALVSVLSASDSCSNPDSRSSVGRKRAPPTVLLPSPGRRQETADKGLIASLERLGKLLDEAESSSSTLNRFSGKRSTMLDFIAPSTFPKDHVPKGTAGIH